MQNNIVFKRVDLLYGLSPYLVKGVVECGFALDTLAFEVTMDLIITFSSHLALSALSQQFKICISSAFVSVLFLNFHFILVGVLIALIFIPPLLLNLIEQTLTFIILFFVWNLTLLCIIIGLSF